MFGGITSSEKYALCNVVYEAVKQAVEKHADLDRIADEFTYGDTGDAFKMCFEKGVQEYILMIEMGKEAERQAEMEKGGSI